MAMIDYGAVVFKNGEQINHSMFMDMKEAVGWEDYPKNRYADCDCVDELGYASCESCPKSQKKHHSHPDLGEWDSVSADCRGKPLHIEGKISGNFFAYIGDEALTFCFYKYYMIAVVDKKVALSLHGADTDYKDQGHMSYRGALNGTMFSVRVVDPHVCHFSMVYNGDVYHVIYGYGIDQDMKIWDRIKTKYLGRSSARKVDGLFRRIRKGW